MSCRLISIAGSPLATTPGAERSRRAWRAGSASGRLERVGDARRIGIDRKTVRKYIERGLEPRSTNRHYNRHRPHQGRWCFGKTPMQTFLDTIPLAKEKLLTA
jgi:hypothetical protein